MDGVSKSHGWDKEIVHGFLPMKQLVLRDKQVKKPCPAVHGYCSCKHLPESFN